jgi:hypothetical protein
MGMKEVKEYDFTKSSADLDKYLINLSEEISDPLPLVKFGNNPVFTRGNISCISGKAKSRKTFLISLLTAQILEDDTKYKVLIFDTEMARYHTAKIAKRIHRLLEWDENKNNDRLKIYTLREASTKERESAVFQSIETYRPDLIFIDGIRDLAMDFNNIQESSELVGKLMKYSSLYDCHICSVLHENKVSDTLRGHLGTEVVNKSETVISVSCSGNISAVSPKFCRNIPFDEFCFTINDSGLPEYCDPEMKPKNEDKLKELFAGLLPAMVSLSFADLRTKVINSTGRVGRTAERYIKEAGEANLIIKNNVGMYYYPENNLPANSADDDRLPFLVTDTIKIPLPTTDIRIYKCENVGSLTVI